MALKDLLRNEDPDNYEVEITEELLLQHLDEF